MADKPSDLIEWLKFFSLKQAPIKTIVTCIVANIVTSLITGIV